jgi:hypothetical protein
MINANRPIMAARPGLSSCALRQGRPSSLFRKIVARHLSWGVGITNPPFMFNNAESAHRQTINFELVEMCFTRRPTASLPIASIPMATTPSGD